MNVSCEECIHLQRGKEPACASTHDVICRGGEHVNMDILFSVLRYCPDRRAKNG